jgi:hypothetical protein
MKKADGQSNRKHDGRLWEIIVEPVPEEQILVIVTAYPID